MVPRKLGDGRLVLQLPVPGSTVISLLDVAPDYGAYVREALEAAQFAGQAGKEVLAASEELTLDQMLKEFNEGAFFLPLLLTQISCCSCLHSTRTPLSSVTGANATYEQVPARDWIAQLGEEGAKAGKELVDMFRWFSEYGFAFFFSRPLVARS